MLNYVEVDLNAISHNTTQLKKIIGPEIKLAAVIKSNGYGHGLVRVAQTVWAAGAEYLAVANLQEAVILREAKIRCPILIMGYVPDADLDEVIAHDLTLTLYDLAYARTISRFAQKREEKIKVHIKIDTGMGRLGILSDKAADFLEQIVYLHNLEIEGIYSHFSDATNKKLGQKQLGFFENVLFQMQKQSIPRPSIVHMANSYATINNSKSHYDMVRCGIAIYGLLPSFKIGKPALSFKTTIAQIKEVPADYCIGYGCTFKTKKSTRIAILTIGYGDGYPRDLSNCGQVLIGGKRCSVIGKVCMNLTIVQLPYDVFPKIGQEVVLIGKQACPPSLRSGVSGRDKEEISTIEIAEKLKTIPHEIVARIPSSVPRVYK